ncbi:MAG TPA: 2'-deoxycytidine 5'-triphosphate deaminase [Caulobacteraceae bacterium]|nr:2'-deoxycytidine 5'-triphosphate deaminase [Caulobacteraceae bacterium]
MSGGVAGILPCQAIEDLARAGAIVSDGGLRPDQVQPASLDLRLGRRAWRVRASFLPRAGRRVAERLDDVAMHELDLSRGAALERGCVYVAEIAEALALPGDLRGRANPKSSTGRVDVFVRVLTDAQGAFDDVAVGYTGPLFLEIAPQTFSILARTGSRLAQIRFKRGQSGPARVRDIGVDLSGPVAGYRARRHAGLVDVDLEAGHDPRDFFAPVEARGGELLLDPGEFYLLVSREALEIPIHEAAEMTPIDPAVGEFRVHYAGFFDPGFGLGEARGAGGAGSRAVLEVRSRETPFLLEHGQTVARLAFEPLIEPAARPYGTGGHYQRQGLALSKHFRPWS